MFFYNKIVGKKKALLIFLASLYVTCSFMKCLRPLIGRVSDQFESLSSFGRCAHFTFHDLRNLLFYIFFLLL